MKKKICAGTYTGKSSRGIYSFQFEDGIMSDVQMFTDIGNPKYLSFADGKLLTVFDDENGAGAALISADGDIIESITYENETSCYIASDGDDIYTANFHAGTVTKLKREGDHLTFIKRKEIRKLAGCHQVLFAKDGIIVPCMEIDKIVMLDRDLEQTAEIVFEEKTGPRHGILTKDKEYLYLASELSNELFVIRMKDLKIIHSISVLAEEERYGEGGAAVRMSDDERFVYVSTRGKNVISVIEMQDHVPAFRQMTCCGGDHPRDFILTDGYLLSANRFSNTVTCFRLTEDGTVGKMTSSVQIPEAVSLQII